MKKIYFSLFLVFCLLFVSTTALASPDDNPINKSFDEGFENALTTYEINYITGQYVLAWKNELKNITSILKNNYSFQEDKAKVDNYFLATQKMAQTAAELEWLNWTDTQTAPEERYPGTGAASASMMAYAEIYKTATLNLIKTYQSILDASTSPAYQYIYTPKKSDFQPE